jgi:hypothetical protein
MRVVLDDNFFRSTFQVIDIKKKELKNLSISKAKLRLFYEKKFCAR